MSLHAAGAERAILSLIMHNPDSYFAVNELITEADFTITGNGIIFNLLKSIITKSNVSKIDRYLVFAEAERLGIQDFYHDTLDGELVEAIEKTPHNKDHLLQFVQTVKQATIKRALVNTFDGLKDTVVGWQGSASELRNTVEENIAKSMKVIDVGETDDLINLSEDFEEVINEFADNPKKGIDVGMPRWQHDVGQIRNGSMTGIFARAKAGKSQFAMWASFKTAIEKKMPVLYLDTELQAREQQMRLCGMMTRIPFEYIESGKWKSHKELVELMKGAFKQIKEAPIYYKNIAGSSVQSVIPSIRKFVYKIVGGPPVGNEPKCLVIYDYLKLMSADDVARIEEWQLLGLLTSSLHDCVAKLNIPMIVLGQLNREGFKVDSELAVAGADRIIHNLDSFTILRKKKPEEIEEDGEMRGNSILKVCVARHGPGHDDPNEWVNLHFERSCGQFVEDKRNSEMGAAKAIMEDTTKFSEARN